MEEEFEERPAVIMIMIARGTRFVYIVAMIRLELMASVQHIYLKKKKLLAAKVPWLAH